MLAALSIALLQGGAATASTGGARYEPDEVVVRYADGTTRAQRAAIHRALGLRSPVATSGQGRALRIPAGASVAGTIAALRRDPRVVSATPNYIAHASQEPGFSPRDPGRGESGDWQRLQWNFVGPFGINAPGAWSNLIAAGKPGGTGVVVAVLDTGVAYRNRGRFRRSPDFAAGAFVRGYDFVDRDGYALDHNGHGTHVAGTIAEQTDNAVAVTGLAYGARIMPVRVLDANGEGDSATIARGIRFAARNGADVINLSLEFSSSVRSREIPEIISALRYAHRKGAVLVAAAGNEASRHVAYPARAAAVISVGATTERGCVSDFSNQGSDLDIVAPGGGADADLASDPNCRPLEPAGRDVYQLTFTSSVRRFGLPGGYEGTSMAAPHVSATAALVLASGVLGASPEPKLVEQRLEATARDLGAPGPDRVYGAGLLDAAAATAAS